MKATLWLSLLFAVFWLGTSQVLYKTRFYGPAYDRTNGVVDTNYCPAANPTDDESVQVASYISRWTGSSDTATADCPTTTYGKKTGYTTTGFADLSLFCNHKTIAGVGLADCSDTVASGTGACAYSNIGTYIGVLFRTYGTIYSYNFRYGPSATCGGLMYIDGQLMNMNSVAMENKNQWADPTQYLQATATQLPKNTWHSIEIITFESNGDTQQSLQYRTATNQNFTGFKHDGTKVGLNYATRLGPLLTGHSPSSPQSTMGNIEITIYGYFLAIDLCPITGDTTCGYGIKSILVGKKPCVITTDRDEFRLNRRQVSCMVPAGQGYATIEFESWDFGVALNQRTFTYAPPVITTISGYSGNTFLTQGGDMVISGTFFGTDPYVILSGYPSPLPNNVACPIKSLTDSAVSGAARITCTVPPGAGYNMLVYIRQCSNMAVQPCSYTYQASYSMAYRWPEHGPIPPALNTWGGQIITLTGANFGRCITADVDVYRKLTVAGLVVSQKIGGVPTCNDTDPWWHNNMVVVTNRGQCGSNLPAITNYNQGNSWTSRYWQYKTGQINQAVSAHTLVTCGTGGYGTTPAGSVCSTMVTITGLYFGPPPGTLYTGSPGATITVTVGDGDSFTSEPVHLDDPSGAAFKFKPPVGRGKGNQIKFSFCGSSGVSYYSLDYGWGLDYQGPSITNVQGSNLKNAGGDTIIVTGNNFGIQLFATKGDLSMFIDTGAGSFTPCLSPSISVAHTEARCVVPPNMMGQKMDFKLCLAGQCTVQTNAISFKAPIISNLQGGVPSTVGYSNFVTQGGEQLTINGANFGQDGSVTVDGKPCATSAGPNWIDTRIVCTIPAGEGYNLRVLVTVAKGNYREDQKITAYVDTFSYAPPKILKLTPNNGPTVGGIRTLVEGTNFGITSYITIGGLSCDPVHLRTHTSVQCTTPIGEGTNRIVQIAVGVPGKERYNYTFAEASNFRFDLPVAQTPQPSNGATNGGNTITINGINFGTNNALISVNHHGINVPGVITLVKGTLADPTDKISYSVPASSGAHDAIYVTVAGQTSKDPVFYDYDPPRIDSLESSKCDVGTYPNVVNCDVKGEIPITIHGANFGAVPAVTTVQLIDPRYATRPTLCRPVNASCPKTTPGCPPCTVDTVDHGQITITLPKKLDGGFNLTLRVDIDGQQTEQAWVSYAAPSLTGMSQPADHKFYLTLEPTSIIFSAKFLCSSEPAPGNYTVKIGLPTQSLAEKPFEWKGCTVTSHAGVCTYNLEETMTCTTPPSSIVGTGLTLQVKSDLLTSADSSWTVTTLQPAIIPNSIRANLNDEGSDMLTSTINVASPICFNVTNVGDDPAKLTVEYFSNETERTYNAYGISLTPGGNHEMQTLCCLGAKGDGKFYRFRVRALNYWSEQGTDLFNYPTPPEILSVFGCTDDHVKNTTHDCPTKAKDANGKDMLLTITANYIDANQLSCTVGTNDCKDPTYDADTSSFTCKLPEGTGIDLPIVVLHGALLSQPSYSVSYKKAAMTKIEGCDAENGNDLSTINCPRKYTDDPSGNGRVITITGTNFGKANSIILVNGRECTEVTHNAATPHEIVTCRLPQLMGQQRTLMFIQALGVIGENQGSISYARCPPGTAFRKDGDLNCYVCEWGTFAGQWGLMECAGCESGTYADSVNMTVCTLCEPGHYSYRVGEKTPSGVIMGPVECNTTTTGFFQSAKGQAQQDACKAGTYSNETGMSYCWACEKGYFQASAAKTQCEQCALGKFAGFEGLSTCDLCIAGTYNGELAASACIQCEASTYASEAGWSACKNCSFGMVSVSKGATECTKCGPGEMANALHTFCDICPKGTFSVGLAEACTPCPIGQFGASAQSGACEDCLGGSYSDQPMSTACRVCSAGSYQKSKKGTDCSLCEPGFYAASSGLEGCVSCPPGSYAAGNGSTSCILCSPGSHAEGVQKTACDLCAPGYYAPTIGAEKCLECPSGSIGPDNGTVQCEACKPGYMADSSKIATECIACKPGTYSDSPSSITCVECPKGFMSSENASISCTRCLAGTYTRDGGFSECMNCTAGTYSPNDGAFECTDCPAGQIAPFEQMTRCILCGVGQYQESPASSYCKVCDAGKYSPVEGQASCKACGRGSVANETGASGCVQCDAGQYQKGTGSSFCQACEVGSYSNLPGATFCVSCLAGYKQPFEGQTFCDACAGGYFQDQSRATMCRACEAGQFAYGQANTFCKDCAAGSVAPYPATAQCSLCQENAKADEHRLYCKCAKKFAGKIWNDTDSGLLNVRCVSCPQGARCDQEGLMVDNLETLSGWWSMGKGQNEFRAYYRCMMPSYCPGGVMPCGEDISKKEERYVCASQCAENRGDALCSLCKEGYTESVGGACRPCGNKGGSWAVAIIVCLAAIIAMWLMCYVVLYTSRSLLRSAEIEDAQRKNAEKGFVEDWVDDAQADTLRFGVLTVKGPPVPKPNFTFKMKIALGFLQIVTQQAVAIDVAWPAIFKTFLSWFNPINFDFLQLSGAGCVVTLGYFNKMKIFIAVPPVVVIVIALIILLPTYIMKATMKSDDWQVAAKTSRKKAWKLLFFVLFLIYPLVSASVLRFFVCRDIEGVKYLVADFAYHCSSSEWDEAAPLAWIFAFVYPIGIPLFFFACVFRYRKRLDEIGTRAQFDFLYDAYHHDYWWWEICDMAHKLILTALIAFFPYDSQMPIAMCIVVLYTMLILLCKPYVRKGDDMLHLFANLELFVLLLAGHIFNSMLEPDELMNDVMGVILIIAVCIFVVYFLLQIIQVLMKWYKDNWKEKQRGGKREPEPDVDEDGLPVYKRSPPVTANLMRTGQNESLEMHRNRLFANTSVEMGNDVVHSELNMLSKDAQALKAIQDSRSQTNSQMTTTGANMSRGNPSATAPITTVSYQITQPTDATNTTATTDAGATTATTPAATTTPTTTVTPRAMDPFAAETELTSV